MSFTEIALSTILSIVVLAIYGQQKSNCYEKEQLTGQYCELTCELPQSCPLTCETEHKPNMLSYLHTLTIRELKSVAREFKLRAYKNFTKAQLIIAINDLVE